MKKVIFKCEQKSLQHTFTTNLSDNCFDWLSITDYESLSQKLFFANFVRKLLFLYIEQVASLRSLPLELKTNPKCQKLGGFYTPFSTLKDGFSRFESKYFKQLFAGVIDISDSGFASFEIINKVIKVEAYFVFRVKDNLHYEVRDSLNIKKFSFQWIESAFMTFVTILVAEHSAQCQHDCVNRVFPSSASCMFRWSSR